MKRLAVSIVLVFLIVFLVPLVFTPTTALAADPLGKRIVKFVISPVIGSAELVTTTITSTLSGQDGPIVSTFKGTMNGLGRVIGEFANIFEDGRYQTPYFKDNPVTQSISTSEVVDVLDWTVTGLAFGLVGANSGWIGMADGEAMAVFGASGVAAEGLMEVANENE